MCVRACKLRVFRIGRHAPTLKLSRDHGALSLPLSIGSHTHTHAHTYTHNSTVQRACCLVRCSSLEQPRSRIKRCTTSESLERRGTPSIDDRSRRECGQFLSFSWRCNLLLLLLLLLITVNRPHRWWQLAQPSCICLRSAFWLVNASHGTCCLAYLGTTDQPTTQPTAPSTKLQTKQDKLACMQARTRYTSNG